MEEAWKDITGYEGLYQISNTGKVRSLRNNILLKQSFCKSGYLKVKLCNTKQVAIQVHRLVAEEFVAGADGNLQVNHKDGNKLNNNATNLEWVTAKENIGHAISLGLFTSKFPTRKIARLNAKGYIERTYDSITEASRELGLGTSNICKACSGASKTAGGYKWKYIQA